MIGLGGVCWLFVIVLGCFAWVFMVVYGLTAAVGLGGCLVAFGF